MPKHGDNYYANLIQKKMGHLFNDAQGASIQMNLLLDGGLKNRLFNRIDQQPDFLDNLARDVKKNPALADKIAGNPAVALQYGKPGVKVASKNDTKADPKPPSKTDHGHKHDHTPSPKKSGPVVVADKGDGKAPAPEGEPDAPATAEAGGLTSMFNANSGIGGFLSKIFSAFLGPELGAIVGGFLGMLFGGKDKGQSAGKTEIATNADKFPGQEPLANQLPNEFKDPNNVITVNFSGGGRAQSPADKLAAKPDPNLNEPIPLRQAQLDMSPVNPTSTSAA